MTARRFAADTIVSVGKTKGEIDALLRRFGATGFGIFEREREAQVVFEAHGRRILFRLPLPEVEAYRRTPVKREWRTDEQTRAAWEQACRAKWRALLLCIKAKTESIASNIESFEEAFLAQIQMPGGRTVYEEVKRPIALRYERQDPTPLASHSPLALPAPKAEEGAQP